MLRCTAEAHRSLGCVTLLTFSGFVFSLTEIDIPQLQVPEWALCVIVAGTEPSMFGFNEFIYKHIIPACFMAPMKPTFDLTDAQTVQVFDAFERNANHPAVFSVSPPDNCSVHKRTNSIAAKLTWLPHLRASCS